MNDIARGEWRSGAESPMYITSDCTADLDVFSPHNFTTTPEQAVATILRAGQDINCGGFMAAHIASAIEKGLASEADIDTALRHTLGVRMRLGHMDPAGPLQSIRQQAVLCNPDAIELARDGAAQGAVLLKNDVSRNDARTGGQPAMLPLSAATVGTVAVLGPHVAAQYGKAMGYYYFGAHGCMPVCGTNSTNMGPFYTIADAFKAHISAKRVVEVAGVENCSSDDRGGIPAAAAAAAKADTVVLAVGTDLTIAAEGKDATSLALSPAQQALVVAVLAAAKDRVLVLLTTAVPLDIADLVANDKVASIVHLGVPGTQAIGVGDVLFGEKSIAGRLDQTFYNRTFGDELSIFDMGLRPGPSDYPRPDCPQRPASSCPRAFNPGVTHKFHTGDPIFEFGFGLSYTSWHYSLAMAPTGPVSLSALRSIVAQTLAANRTFVAREAILAAAHAAPPPATYVVNVTNTGAVDSDEVILGFLAPPGAGIEGVPLQSLFGFQRVHVAAGASTAVTLYPELLEFSQVDRQGRRYVLGGSYTVWFGVRKTLARGGGFVQHSFIAA
jgi:hypothetical protein